jgi:4-aminobutyrate aminotransferase-like enzyme
MAKLIADSFRSDPRVAQAKALVLETLAEYQARITGVRPPDPALKRPYQDLIDEFGELRGGALLYPYLGAGIGRGPLVELADGSVKYDFISGIGVHHWGHSHPAIVEASLSAAMQDTVMQGNLQQNAESVELARILLVAANSKGAALKHCFFSTSGATANENALKVIFQKRTPADRLLAFEGCFMGRTLALSHITDRAAYREGLPAMMSVDYVPFFNQEHPAESTKSSVEHLRRYLARYPGRHAAMIFELVLGEGGFYPGSRDFFAALMEVAKENGLALMVDEIQTFGRTTELFAYQDLGLDEFVDVVTIGKLAHVPATLFKGEFKPKPGLLSQTFTSTTAAIFAARVIIKGLLEDGYFGRDGKIARLHDHFERRLREIGERHPGLIAGPFGIGGMIAFTPFRGDPDKVKKFVHALFDAGVISFYCGSDYSRVRFLIPVGAISPEQIDDALDIVETTLGKVANAS